MMSSGAILLQVPGSPPSTLLPIPSPRQALYEGAHVLPDGAIAPLTVPSAMELLLPGTGEAEQQQRR